VQKLRTDWRLRVAVSASITMTTIESFRDLDVWRAAMDLTVLMYGLTDKLPHHEQFGLTAQIRRSAVSIPANIAEGHNSRMNGRYRNHVRIALGSQGELDTLVELAVRLRFVTAHEGLLRSCS
jgi:four helix bundle protein